MDTYVYLHLLVEAIIQHKIVCHAYSVRLHGVSMAVEEVPHSGCSHIREKQRVKHTVAAGVQAYSSSNISVNARQQTVIEVGHTSTFSHSVLVFFIKPKWGKQTAVAVHFVWFLSLQASW